MVRINEDSIVIKIENKITSPEDIYNYQISIIDAIQFFDPQHNPLGFSINPIYYLLELLKATLPDLENYDKAYKPENSFQVPLSVNLSEKQCLVLRSALLGLNGTKPVGRGKEILEILKEVE